MVATLQTKSKLPNSVNTLLVIALGILASKLMWMILSPAKKENYQAQVVGVASESQKKIINYGKLIADSHLFGEIKKVNVIKDTPKAPVKAAVVPTKLNLKLHGIVAYKDKNGFALISSRGGPQKVYGETEVIQTGVTVSKIYPEKVVLNNNGQSEDLLLPKKKTNSKRPSASNNRKNSKPPNLLRPKPEEQTFSKNIKVEKSDFDLGKFRQQAAANPQKLMEIVRPSPAMVNGQFVGFRVQPGKQRKAFRNLGFRPNDIITEVNGILLDDASKGTMVLAELAQASNLSVKVKRGDQEIIIDHSF